MSEISFCAGRFSIFRGIWSGRRDLNSGPLAPQFAHLNHLQAPCAENTRLTRARFGPQMFPRGSFLRSGLRFDSTFGSKLIVSSSHTRAVDSAIRVVSGGDNKMISIQDAPHWSWRRPETPGAPRFSAWRALLVGIEVDALLFAEVRYKPRNVLGEAVEEARQRESDRGCLLMQLADEQASVEIVEPA